MKTYKELKELVENKHLDKAVKVIASIAKKEQDHVRKTGGTWLSHVTTDEDEEKAKKSDHILYNDNVSIKIRNYIYDNKYVTKYESSNKEQKDQIITELMNKFNITKSTARYYLRDHRTIHKRTSMKRKLKIQIKNMRKN